MKKKTVIKKEFSEFKEFIAKGNVMDMAVGVIIGGAFGKIVTSLVNDILMPIIGIFMGGLDFSGLSFKIGEAKISYGLFIQTIIDFLIVAFCIFMIIKFISKLKKKEQKVEKEKKSDSILLLEEIRDLLKENNKK